MTSRSTVVLALVLTAASVQPLLAASARGETGSQFGVGVSVHGDFWLRGRDAVTLGELIVPWGQVETDAPMRIHPTVDVLWTGTLFDTWHPGIRLGIGLGGVELFDAYSSNLRPNLVLTHDVSDHLALGIEVGTYLAFSVEWDQTWYLAINPGLFSGTSPRMTLSASFDYLFSF